MPVFLLGKPQGQRSLGAIVHGVAKSWTQVSARPHTHTDTVTHTFTHRHTHSHTHTHTLTDTHTLSDTLTLTAVRGGRQGSKDRAAL